MIKVTQKDWDNIPKDYKGRWERWIKDGGWQPDLPEEFIGRRTVLSGCISDEIGCLLTEGVHFEIVEDKEATKEQHEEILRLWKTHNLPILELPKTYDVAEKIIQEVKGNWGE